MKVDTDAHPQIVIAVDQDVVHIFNQFGEAWCDDDNLDPETTKLAEGGTPAENGFGDDPGVWPWCDTCLRQGRDEAALVE